MPYSHDQPDNAARVTRLGIARTIPRSRYQASLASAELSLLLNTPSYAQKATRIAQEMATEQGVESACDALEAM
jgi:UDP:flavonoid glycosyltransferase YjiC (YdhE family)